MPFFKSIGEQDKVPHAFAKFNTGIERPLIDLHQILMRSEDSPFSVAQRELFAAFVSGTNACKYCITGSGVFKGYNNIKDLIDSLNNNKNLNTALDQWNSIQVATGKRLLALGEQMEKAFIWEPLDFAEVDEESTQNWWKKSVAFPESFNYETG
jgi:hypothetical protein